MLHRISPRINSTRYDQRKTTVWPLCLVLLFVNETGNRILEWTRISRFYSQYGGFPFRLILVRPSITLPFYKE